MWLHQGGQRVTLEGTTQGQGHSCSEQYVLQGVSPREVPKPLVSAE